MSLGHTTDSSPTISFAQLWFGLFAFVDCQNQAILKCLEPSSDPRMVRKRWLDTMSSFVDDYYKSAAFLQVMQLSMKTMNESKRIQNEFMATVTRQLGVPLAGDIYEMADRLQYAEANILGHLDSIEDRLKSMENTIGATTEVPD
jgi:hypothetical protein